MPQKVAERWGIPKVHDTPEALIEDTDVEIVDLAFPPDQQPALIRHALKQKHIKAILAQKPLALSLEEAIKLRDEAEKAGKILSVNQNMRYDQSMRVLKQIIDSGALGEIVFAQIDMHAIPHWQTFLEEYDRLTLSNMSVHHLDVLRFLFGDPEEITTLTRKDPRTKFDHSDGITVSTHEVSRRACWRCRWRMCGPARARRATRTTSTSTGASKAREGVAKGTIGWPTGAASTLTYASAKTTGGKWVTPSWDTMWFPHAFIGVMEQLQHAVKTGTRAGALRRRQRQDHGARRGRLPLDRRGPHRQALRNLNQLTIR